jgi:thiamine-phosphate pyrophosphorylase
MVAQNRQLGQERVRKPPHLQVSAALLSDGFRAPQSLNSVVAKMKPLSECQLYTFVDTAYLQGRVPEEVCSDLCRGGADLVQLRAKNASAGEVRSMAKLLLRITQDVGVGLVINDHLDIALEIGADLCHLGQEDFSSTGFSSVPKLRPSGSNLQIGLSTHSPDQARSALTAEADYIAIGPVYATATKPGARPVTLDYVRWAAANVETPWFAIGGINLGNLDQVLAAGAKRICIVSAILNATDVAAECRKFRERLS